MIRFLQICSTALIGLGIILSLAGVSYWLLGRQPPITRSLPMARTPTTRVIENVGAALDTVSATLRGTSTLPVPILTYHYIRPDINQNDDPLGYQLSIPPDLFAAQLDALQQAGYTTVTPTQFLQGKIDEHSLILSFDDGYADLATNAFPALTRRGMTAVAFVVSGFLDDRDHRYLSSDQVRELKAGGIEIGAHTITHSNLTKLEPLKLQEELLQSRFALEKLINDRVIAVAYPSGEYNDAVVDMAEFVGYRFGVTTQPGTARLADPHLTLPRIQIHPGDNPERLVERIKDAKRLLAAPQ
ncbi:polysaccharide deacetylase family protein [Candidatus Berkelbacteria bacterium]|nr:polysaccharide deacetylase family protein [Candidatus Berkelbacteria bacterium]